MSGDYIRFEIPEPTILLNQYLRMHWKARRRYVQRLAWRIRAAIGARRRRPMEQCRIEIERHSAGLPDWDGLYGGLKGLLDCLVVCTDRNPHGLGLIRDDNPECVVRLVARPVSAPRGQGKTVVTIREVMAEQREAA
ncbi:hypothetical protein [Arhodomonas sp. AD133]|uniref:hypothetical protein n=1 Tax=Arhodomonas sp. AD133 TaxID=3415009 RepID=UPI003EB711F1